MSLQEAYRLAHTADCRLRLAANRPDRDLRFVVGHLMHYESLRLRIVEIEHDIRKGEQTSAVQSQGIAKNSSGSQQKHSTVHSGKRSPPPSEFAMPVEGEDEDDIDGDWDDSGIVEDPDIDDEDGLGLMRFPSGSARPPPLETDMGEDESDDEPVSPEEPDEATLKRALQGDSDDELKTAYEGVKKCRCHGRTDAADFEKVWRLPANQENEKPGVTRVVAQVAVGAD